MFKKNAKGGYIPPEPPMFKYENVQTEAEIEKPMNPNAEKDFREAIEKAKKCPAIDYLYFEPKYEEEHINRVRLAYYPHAWEDVINILLSNGYKVSIVKVEAPDSKDDKVEITWKDKNDLVDEFKKMVREIEL